MSAYDEWAKGEARAGVEEMGDMAPPAPPSPWAIQAELWRRMRVRQDRLEAKVDQLIKALQAGAIGRWQ